MIISEEILQRNDFLKNHTAYFLDVRVDNITKETALEFINGFINNKDEEKARKIFFTNVHTIHLARKSRKFRDTVNSADLCLPDGSGLKLAGKIFSKSIKENLNGTDFTPIILKQAEAKGWKVYLLGARQNILIKCAAKIEETYPQLNIVGLHSGYFHPDEIASIIRDIKDTSPDILLVAMGSPNQELLIEYISKQLKDVVCFAVGGLFDFLSGDKKRAPLFIRKIGLEWVFRFFNDPKSKWNRIFIEIPYFLFLIFVKKVTPNSMYNTINRKLGYR